MKITVWSKSDCSQCTMTKNLMKREGLDFVEADLEADPAQLQKFKDAGLLQAPIVVLGKEGRSWAGFRPDLIKELAHHEPVAE
ncbi:MAG TPA: glutaredoxin domain-containing protein [Arthrobacter sp.]